MFGQEDIVTKDFILQRISEEDIFRRYLGFEPSVVGSYINPLRDDSDPGCGFYVDDRGVWKFKDFAGGYNWDCFNIVEYGWNLSFKQALIKIAGDFNLINTSGTAYVSISKVAKIRRKIGLRIKRREWTNEDYKFWSEYSISPARLEFFHVSPVSMVWFEENGNLRLAYGNKSGDPAFAYHFGDYKYKIYLPLRKKGSRFIHTTSTIIQGYDQLPDFAKYLVITKSYKDVMCIDNFREYDIYSVAPMSETVLLSQEAFINFYNRFDYIVTLFDFDRTGIRLMRKYQEAYKLPFLMFGKDYKKQGIKDFADHVKIKGVEETKLLIENALIRR